MAWTHTRLESREVGDGNLNLVFIVEGHKGAAVVKQALPYVRLVGESWPLPLKRSFFEYHALTRQEERARHRPGDLPFRRGPGAHRHGIPLAACHSAPGADRGPHCRRSPAISACSWRARCSAAPTSPRYQARKEDLALFADNAELCDITENLVFTDPYYEAKLNRHTSPQLDGIVAELRADRDLKVEAQRLKHMFAAKPRRCCMAICIPARSWSPRRYARHRSRVRLLWADGLRCRHAARQFLDGLFFPVRPRKGGRPRAMRRYLLGVIVEIWAVFRTEFSHLWRTERTGMLYDRTLFEDRGDTLGAEQALDRVLHDIWVDMLGFAGVEIHRRILGLAHNADFETIDDEDLRAAARPRR